MASEHPTSLNNAKPQQAFVTSIEEYTMGASLRNYVSMKVHIAVRSRPWSKIIVRGLYERTPPAQTSPDEKHDKPFNWQRPTATEIDATTLQLNCFPGNDYVQHYASLLATYLFLVGQHATIVQYISPNPSDSMNQFLHSNLAQMGHTDIVVVGYVHHLDNFMTGSWEGAGNAEDNLFAWQKVQRHGGCSIALLGCMVSFWGDISGHLVRALQRLNKVKCVLYIGKAGSLLAKYAPDQWLVTGDCSSMEGRTVSWDNILKPYLELSPVAIEGSHVTIPSPLFATRSWLEKWQSECSWVDSEVGYMAEASNEGATSFGYLHIISDNVASRYPYDLSNERLKNVILDRRKLFIEMQKILDAFFTRWNSCNSTKDVGNKIDVLQ
jgi:hypothetical protein